MLPDAPQIDFEYEDDLVDRLLSVYETNRPVVFVLGSALCLPMGGSPGVPGVAQMVDLVREALPERLRAKFDVSVKAAPDKYQAAFQFAISKVGQDCANLVVQRAVLQAQSPGHGVAPPSPPLEKVACLGLEMVPGHWHLTPGLEALSHLAGTTVLTTNFDPLIEIALARVGRHYHTSVLPIDGSLNQTSGPGCHVAHLHGYWHGDTLHTPKQLTQPRPFLKQSLGSLLKGATVVVLGYGGWDDVLMAALHDVAYDTEARLDVLWGFYEQDGEVVLQKYPHVFQKLRTLPIGRFQPYKAVDLHRLLPRLNQERGQSPSPPPPPLGRPDPSPPVPAAGVPALATRPSPSAIVSQNADMDRPFTQDEIWELVDAAVSTNLYSPGGRTLQLNGLPAGFTATLPEKHSPRDALLSDLSELNRHDEIVGHAGRPIQTWLANAWHRTKALPIANEFLRFLIRRPGAAAPPKAPKAPKPAHDADSEDHIGGDDDLRAELEAFWLGHPREATLIAEALDLVSPGVDPTTLDTLAKVLTRPPDAIVLGIEDAAGGVGAAELGPFLELLPLVARRLARPDRDGGGTDALGWPRTPANGPVVSGGPAPLELPLKSATLIEVYVAALQGRPPSFKQPAAGERVQAEGERHVGLSSAADAGLIDVRQVTRSTVSTLEQRELLQMAVASRVGGWTGRGDLPQFKGWLLRHRKTPKGGKPSWYVVFDAARCLPDNAPPSATEALWATVSHAFAECMSQLTLYRVRGGLIEESLEHMIAYAMTEILRRQMETKA